jgi:LacI family transcriptional regulator
LHYVTNDQRAIIRLAMRKITALGYRRIGFATPPAWDRLLDGAFSAGFAGEQVLLDPADQIPIMPCADTTPVGALRWKVDLAEAHAAFAKWYRRYKPEVIIGYGQIVLPRLQQLELRVPQDVAFVDIVLEDRTGQLAGVKHNSARVGEVAVEMVAGQLQHGVRGIPSVPMATLVQGSWYDGASLPART